MLAGVLFVFVWRELIGSLGRDNLFYIRCASKLAMTAQSDCNERSFAVTTMNIPAIRLRVASPNDSSQPCAPINNPTFRPQCHASITNAANAITL